MLVTLAVREARRSPTITGTLLVLLALAVMLAAAGAGLMARLGGAADDFLERARAPHVAQMHTGAVDPAQLEAWSAQHPEVVAHQDMLLLGIDGGDLRFDGRSQADNVQENSLVVPSAERDLLLRTDGTALTAVKPGEIWLPVMYHLEQKLEVGQSVTITGPDGFELELRIAGFMRDSLMNTAIASSKRLAVSAQDQALVREHTGIEEHLIALWLADPEATAAGVCAYQSADLPDNGPIVTTGAFRLFTIFGDGLVAGVVLLVAALLMAVGLLCLRLALLTALQQDTREISVLRAIGIPLHQVRRMHLLRYAIIAAAATAVGLGGALLLIPRLARELTAYTGAKASPAQLLVPVPTALLVLALVLLTVHLMLRRIAQLNPVDGLRATAGQARTRRTGLLPLHYIGRGPLPVILGVMELLRRPGRYLLLLVVFAISTVIVVVPTNAALTLASPDFPRTVGLPAGDLLIQIQHSGPDSDRDLDLVTRELEDADEVTDSITYTTTRWQVVDRDGAQIQLDVDNGDHSRLPLTYAEGREPRTADEIALSLLAIADLGADLGETITLHGAEGPVDLTVVGTYQDVTNGGSTAKAVLPTRGQEVVRHAISAQLGKGADIDALTARLNGAQTPMRVADTHHYAHQQFGPIAEQMQTVAVLAAAVALTLAAMMAAMTVRLLLASEQAEVAIQRSLGIGDAALRAQFLTRVLIVLALGVGLGAIAAGTAGEAMFNVLFELLYSGQLLSGTSRISLTGIPWLTWGILPALLIAATAAATVAACRWLQTMTVSSLNAE